MTHAARRLPAILVGMSMFLGSSSAPAQPAQTQPATSQPASAITFDGQVTLAETEACFRTRRFQIFRSDKPADDQVATYAYLGKTQIEGRDYLYVAYVCMDPKLGDLVIYHASGTVGIALDDSVEFFIDVEGKRRGFYQILVNARAERQSTLIGDVSLRRRRSERFDGDVQVKTHISRDAGQWTCEILIPYDQFPSVPAKGTKVAANFCRTYRGQASADPQSMQTWTEYATPGRSYHDLRNYGEVEWP